MAAKVRKSSVCSTRLLRDLMQHEPECIRDAETGAHIAGARARRAADDKPESSFLEVMPSSVR